MSKCRAKVPTACRVHGNKLIASKLYNEYTVKQGFKSNPEDYVEIVDQLNLIIDSLETDGDSAKDAEYILKLLEATYWNYPDSAYNKLFSKADFHAQELVQKVVWLKDAKATVIAEPNLLVKPTDKSSYKAYDHALAHYLVDKGYPVRQGDTYYGWGDYEMNQHIKNCKIVGVEQVKEDSWREFVDTLSEDDATIHGITGKAQCRCGYFKGKLRIETRTTEIIKDLANNYFN